MKKAISLLIITIILIGMATPALAASDTSIQPRFAYIETAWTLITIDQSSGTATCDGYVSAKGNNPVKVHVQLQVKDNGIWRSLSTRIMSEDKEAYISFQYKVEKGYEYKVVTNVYVYNANGTLLESNVLTKFANYPAS